MIPKIIHYCWFGKGEMDEVSKKCIESWKKFLPDYELKLWNEETFDVESNPYTKAAYEDKKYAFVANYVRCKALYEEGGIYLDTDVEVLKPFDELLDKPYAFAMYRSQAVHCGVMLTEKENALFKAVLGEYEAMKYDDKKTLASVLSYVVWRDYALHICNNINDIKEGEKVLNSFKHEVFDNKEKGYAVHYRNESWKGEDK